MKILTRRKVNIPIPVIEVEEPKKTRKSCKDNKLPSDEYKDEIEPIEIKLDDTGKLVISVKRGGEFGLPKVDIRLFATTEVYTGFTKKGINFNLDKLPKLKAILCDVIEECDEKGLFEDFENWPNFGVVSV